MKVEVNVNKRYFFGILGAVLILAGVIGAIAYGTSSPSSFGHSLGEIDGIPTCNAGEVLTKTGATMTCVSQSGGSGGKTCVGANIIADRTARNVDLNLLVSNQNICRTANGCDVIVYSVVKYPGGANSVLDVVTDISQKTFIISPGNNRWSSDNDVSTDSRGVLGDNNNDAVVSQGSQGCVLYDDYGSSQGLDKLVLRYNGDYWSCYASVCAR